MDFIAAVETATRHMRNADRALEAGDTDRAAHLADLARKSSARAIAALGGEFPELASESEAALAKFNERHPATA